jgi:hypothetical protein
MKKVHYHGGEWSTHADCLRVKTPEMLLTREVSRVTCKACLKTAPVQGVLQALE